MHTHSFPPNTLLKFGQFKDRVNLSRPTWRKLVKEGKAPKPFKLCYNTNLYRSEDLNRFLEDPANFQP